MSKYYYAGGFACGFEDCFACSNGMCELLKASYKNDEVCPFYKAYKQNGEPEIDLDSDIATVRYANDKIGKLKIERQTKMEIVENLKREISKLDSKIKEAKHQKVLAEEKIKKAIIDRN